MTENKRFMLDDAGELIDKETAQFIEYGEKVCNLLNELATKCSQLKKENEQLKQSYKEFEDECQSTFNAMSRKQDDLYRKNFKLKEENEQLKQELKIYRKVANCSNCEYQNYDWYDDGDEFEICERGNNEQQIEYHICEEWREL